MRIGLVSWFRSAGIAGRFMLILVPFLLLGLWVGAGFYIRDQAQTTVRLFSDSIVRRIGVIVPLLERTSASARPELLRALNSPTLRIGVTGQPMPAAAARAAAWRASSGASPRTPARSRRSRCFRAHGRPLASAAA